MKKFIYVATLCLICKASYAQSLQCKVIAIYDSDIVTCITKEKNQLKIRLANIDAPEKGQPFGQAAKRELSKLVYQKQITVKMKNYDRYGRLIAEIYTIQKEPINLLMVKKSMTRAYERYLTDNRYLEAQRLKIGLWIDKTPTLPELFRDK